MQTPTLNRKQSKKALSGKKRKSQVIKNVLSKPYKIYWPLLSEEDNVSIVELLKSSLPRIENIKINIPYEKIKSIPKHERKKFRMECSGGPPSITAEERKNLIFGFNDVSAAIENGNATFSLITADVTPQVLVQPIIDLCVLRSTPVLIVSGLREVLKSVCGIRSCCFALGKFEEENLQLNSLFEHVAGLCTKHRVPENHINFNRQEEARREVPHKPASRKRKLPVSKQVPFKNYQIERVANDRAFIPEKDNSTKDDNFISIDLTTPVIPKQNIVKKPKKYQNLAVKKLTKDENRNKRKLNKIKKNKKPK